MRYRMFSKLLSVFFSIFLLSGCAEMGQTHRRDAGIAKAPVFKPYQGIKKRIAVTSFVNKVSGVPGNQNIGEGMSEMLITELIKTGRFVVIERQALQDILAEQELGMTGIVNRETAAKVGQILGAQIIVRGVVSEFSMRKSGGGGDITIKGFSLGTKSSNAHVAVDIRMIDASTGQILHSHNASGTAVSTGLTFGYAESDFDFKAGGFQKTPLGQATRQAIQSSVSFIVNKMKQMPFTAKVIKSKGNNIYINSGSLMNVKPGDRFNAFSKGEEFIDPDTGLNLGSEETLVGTVEISDVKDKYSIGLLKSGSGTLKRGDIIKGATGNKTYNISAAARPYFDRGNALYEKKDYKSAEAEYRKALKHEPNSPLYHNQLAISLDGQGNYTEAISHYRRALQSEPDDAVTRGNLAFDLKRTGRLDEAKKEYEAVLRINPNDKIAKEQVLLIPGGILFKKKDYAGAEAEYRKAAEQLPNFSSAHNGVGAALTWQGKWAESIPYYKKAVQLSPNDSVFHKNLANALIETGKLEEAKKEYEAVLRLNPNDKRARESLEATNIEAMFQKIISLEEKGDDKGAEKAFQEVIKVTPDETQALFELDKKRANKIRANTPKGQQHSWLGINIMIFSPEERTKYLNSNVAGVPDKDTRGMLVVGVNAGSVAEKAGIQPVIHKPGATGNNPEDFTKIGDIIIEIDGLPALGRLLSHLATKKPGDTVSLSLIRDGKPRTVTVTLKARLK